MLLVYYLDYVFCSGFFNCWLLLMFLGVTVLLSLSFVICFVLIANHVKAPFKHLFLMLYKLSYYHYYWTHDHNTFSIFWKVKILPNKLSVPSFHYPSLHPGNRELWQHGSSHMARGKMLLCLDEAFKRDFGPRLSLRMLIINWQVILLPTTVGTDFNYLVG